MKIRVVFMGRSYVSGAALPGELELLEGASLDDALTQMASAIAGNQLPPSSCLVTVSGKHLGTWAQHQNCELRTGDEILLIAPVAGG